MTAAAVASIVLAGISALQTVLTSWFGPLFDKLWHHLLRAYLDQYKWDDPSGEDQDRDQLGLRAFLDDREAGKMRSDVVVRLMRRAAGVAATLATLLALVVAGVLATVAGVLFDRDALAWGAAAVMSGSIALFVTLLLLAAFGRISDYRVGTPARGGFLGFLDDRHPTTLRFYQDLSLILSCALVAFATAMTL